MADSRSGSSGSGSSGSGSSSKRSPLLTALMSSVKTGRRAAKKTKKSKKRLRKRQATLRQRDRLLQKRLEGYAMLDIRDVEPELLKEIDIHMTQCWAETSLASDAVRDLRYSRDRVQDIILKRNTAGEIIFSRIITRIPEANGVYVNYTCVSPDERSKGHYKNSLHVMRKYYEGTPYVYIFNQADTKDAGGMDHSTRLKVFHKLGYRLNPDYAVVGGEDEKGVGPLVVRLKTGEVAEYIGTRTSASSSTMTHPYSVKTATGVRVIGPDDIDRCIARKRFRHGSSYSMRQYVPLTVGDQVVEGMLQRILAQEQMKLSIPKTYWRCSMHQWQAIPMMPSCTRRGIVRFGCCSKRDNELEWSHPFHFKRMKRVGYCIIRLGRITSQTA